MSTTTSKPWTHCVLGAALVPYAAYFTFVGTDAFYCGFLHAFSIAGFFALLVPIPATALGVLAAIGLACRRGGFDAGRLRIPFAVLACAAGAAGIAYGIQAHPQGCPGAL